jgi:transcriptional regulator
MNLEKILAISGKPGLYVLKVQTRTGFVAESLIDGKKITVNLKSNVSLLSEISIYTYEGEKPLTEVMQIIAKKENNGQAISHKEDNATLTAYFKEILPDFDEERVYPSDIKKVLNWYNTLQAKGLVTDLAPAPAETKEEKAPAAEEKPKKAPAVKKAKAKKEE